jgi:small nuclear ribonucleoprotein (snRNP)-like protein
MAGFDQKSNVVLSDSKERVYSMEEGVEEIPLGLYLVKGDMMYVSSFIRFSSMYRSQILDGSVS